MLIFYLMLHTYAQCTYWRWSMHKTWETPLSTICADSDIFLKMLNYICLPVYLLLCVRVCARVCACGDQGTTFRSQLSPSALRIRGVEPRLSDFYPSLFPRPSLFNGCAFSLWCGWTIKYLASIHLFILRPDFCHRVSTAVHRWWASFLCHHLVG